MSQFSIKDLPYQKTSLDIYKNVGTIFYSERLKLENFKGKQFLVNVQAFEKKRKKSVPDMNIRQEGTG